MRVTPLHKRVTDRYGAKATYAAAPLYDFEYFDLEN